MIGVGNMGRALLRYKGFAAQGFRIVAAFDADPRVAGTKIEGIPVYSQQRLIEIVRQQRIQLGHDHRSSVRRHSRSPTN